MAIINLHKNHPLDDGRQSERALFVRRGVMRLLLSLGFAPLSELSLADGRRADLLAVSSKGEIWIIEVKSSIADLKADNKWPDYRAFCDKLFFATHSDVPMDLFPEDCGFILADSYGGHVLREAPEHKLNAARRKAVIQRFGRASATRLARAELDGLIIDQKQLDCENTD
ncbi:MmcB family DNA repair protein [Bartonella sp. HY761]|uniref:MmcB family DNA repair protein n=1 Tax=Bartonella sp. HY761 TaxID=2979330 RepID=UPI0021FB0A22|nr:MmcB family DNA repair protein [Bartonella sp. HY761]UXN05846.1 MmcB family DNA repair protein [Bartonella sp. HY761]